MEEQLISYETAKLAFEKGLAVTSKCYNAKGEPRIISLVARRLLKEGEEFYPRVTQSFLQKWLREKHDIHIAILPFIDVKGNQRFEGNIFSDKYEEDYDWIIGNDNQGNFNTYEEALENCLQESLTLI